MTPLSVCEVHFTQTEHGMDTEVTSSFNGKTVTTHASGNGRLDAVSNALKQAYDLQFELVTYQEHALEKTPVPERLPMWESRSRTKRWHGAQVFTQILFTLPLMLWSLPSIIGRQRILYEKQK